MKALIKRIRRLLDTRRTRGQLRRVISIVACLVVFVTTYALVLPAITMETVARCGKEAHEHTAGCYEKILICREPEVDGHHHTDDCYRIEKVLDCNMEEHTHGPECRDAEGNLTCKKAEHTHGDTCYREEKELICGQKESEGHHHTDACYQNELACGKEVHIHSSECYKNDDPADQDDIFAGGNPADFSDDNSAGITFTDDGFTNDGSVDREFTDDGFTDIGFGDGGFIDNEFSDGDITFSDGDLEFTEPDGFDGADEFTGGADPEDGSGSMETQGLEDGTVYEDPAGAEDGTVYEDPAYAEDGTYNEDPETDNQYGEPTYSEEIADSAVPGAEGETLGDENADPAADAETPDGTEVVNPDEAGVSTEPDGTTLNEDPVGSGEEQNPDGSAAANIEAADIEKEAQSGEEAGMDKTTETDAPGAEAQDSKTAQDAATEQDGTAADTEKADGAGTASDKEKTDGTDAAASEGTETDSAETDEALKDQTGADKDQNMDSFAEANQLQAPADLERFLTDRTGIWYYPAVFDEDGKADTADINSETITDWKKVEEDTVLSPEDFVRIYLAYTLPAGTLSETNSVARYTLPANLHLTPAQIEAINTHENGYYLSLEEDAQTEGDHAEESMENPADSPAEEILVQGDQNAAEDIPSEDDNATAGPDAQKTERQDYLGAEAVEGSRTPGQPLNDQKEEYISAVVKAEEIYDEGGNLLGQELVFTFLPYTVEKNGNVYADTDTAASGSLDDADDAEASDDLIRDLIREGGTVSGFLTVDFSTGQIDFADTETDNIKTAEITFARENETEGIGLIRESLTMNTSADFRKTRETGTGQEGEENSGSDKKEEEAPEDKTAGEKDTTSDEKDADKEKDKKEKDPDEDTGETADKDTAHKEGTDLPADAMPARTFEDSITLETARPASVGETGTIAEAAGALPARSEIKVRVEADEGTFPAGTTMVLSAVDSKDMDAVAEAVENAVINNADADGKKKSENTKTSKTCGFQAVDITFRDADGNEIEPAKPVRVVMTSSLIKEAAQNNAISAPVVVHVDNEGKGEQIDLIDPEKIEAAKGRTEEELLQEAEAAREAEEKLTKEAETARKTEENAGPEEKTEAEDRTEDTEEKYQAAEDKSEASKDTSAVATEEAELMKKTETDRYDRSKETVSDAGLDEAGKATSEDSVGYETDRFSVYAIVYTVDFHWEVDGKTYEFSIPGGGYVTLQQLVEVLGIAKSDTYNENTSDDAGNGGKFSGEDDKYSLGEVPGAENGTYGGNEENSDNAVEVSGNESNRTTNTAISSNTESSVYENAVTLNNVAVSEKTKELVADVENVRFSSPELVWVGKIDETTTVGALKNANELNVKYSSELTEDRIKEINSSTVEGGDWALISILPFESEETLTVTMKNGDVWTVRITDAKNAIMNDDEVTVQTIPNPTGTTIHLFDYWVDTSSGGQNKVARTGWPGYTGRTGYESNFWNYFTYTPNNNSSNGNNSGINNGHKLKFVPSMSGQVYDYELATGNSTGASQDGHITDRINGWNGENRNNTNYYNGHPTQGIVAGALYDSSGSLDVAGYPRLNLNNGNGDASNRESLAYLFDPDVSHIGKETLGDENGVNGLFYVDPDGYYTYESMDYKAKLQDDYTFRVTEQPGAATREGEIGFWPIGDLNYWLGMHMQVNFSMPQNGEVLNPKGLSLPMQFEFAGDDDAWVYIDGILVADGGGIHNRTEIDINFKTGKAEVRGGEYTNILNPYEPVVSNETLYQIFTRAHNNGLISDEKWASDYTNTDTNLVWVDSDGDGTFDTFAPGTHHTFDFFYLERGGGESNLYIHYNLVSTTDFSAHKSYHAQTNTENARLNRNEFYFELIGFDNDAYSEDNLGQAVMPDPVILDPTKPEGDFENPISEHVPGTESMAAHSRVYISASEDGNVNFGNKQISSAYAGKEYKYMVREVVPDDAVNADGVRWADASEELKEEGGFVYNGITYDSRVYYFIGRVQETSAGSGQYELKKYRYLDPEYQQPDTQTKFFSFVNGFEQPVTFKVIKKNDNGAVLSGAEFSLVRAMQHHDNKWVVREYTLNNEIHHSEPVAATSNTQGELTFNGLTEGHYILEETAAPEGYARGETYRWLLTLEKQDSADKILLVPYLTALDEEGNPIGDRVSLNLPDANNIFEHEIINEPLPPIDLSLEKKWNDNGNMSVPEGAEATFELHRIKQASPTALIELRDRNNTLVSTLDGVRAGDVIKIYDDRDEGDNAFRIHIDDPDGFAVGMYEFINRQPYPSSRNENINPNDNSWNIETDNRYRIIGGRVACVDSVSTSNGQYTVRETDINNGIIKLSLSAAYTFDKAPKMYVASQGGSVGTTSVDEVINTFTLKSQNGDGDVDNVWKKNFDDLPVVDEYGHLYTYYFKEVSHNPVDYSIQTVTVNGDAGSIGSGSTLTADSTVIVTNNTPDKPKIIANKVWKDENGTVITDETALQGLEVRLTLYKGNIPASVQDTKDSIIQTITGNGEAVWHMKNANADVTQYSVRETQVKIPGGEFTDVTGTNPFGGTVTGDSENGYAITNQLPKSELSVTKQWKDGTAANADKVFDEAKIITFTLYQKLGDGDPSVYTDYGTNGQGTITYTPASGSTVASWSTEMIQNLPKYIYSDEMWQEAVYYPVESTIENVSITTTYQKDSNTPSETPSDAAASSGTVTIINTDIVVPLKIVKVDAHNRETALSGAKFQLMRKLSGESVFTKFEHDSFEEEGNDNKKTGPFTVELTEGIVLEDLIPGEYRIEERTAPDGYIITLQSYTFALTETGTVTSSDTDNELVVPLQKDNDNPAGLQIANEPGAALPNTGGAGTNLVYLIGCILTMLAGAGIVMKKRRREAV